jgi:hypothetical protein
VTAIADAWLAALLPCWPLLALWATLDARGRYRRRSAVVASGVVALALPYLGAAVHLLVRPRRLSELHEADVRERFLLRLAPPEALPAGAPGEPATVVPPVAEPAPAV